MATKTITLDISPTEGSNWSISFDADDSTPIKDITEFNLSVVNPNYPNLFYVVSTNAYQGSGVEYVTWRSTIIPLDSQHPITGYGADIWSTKFYENYMTANGNLGLTWNQMLTNGENSNSVYNLSQDKWSLVYDYSQRYPISYSKGGTLTVTVV